jgi:hypothetical protein
MNYISINPIQFGELQEKTANAINWTVGGVSRNAEEAIAYCALIMVNPDGSSEHVHSFNVTIDYNTLQAWGADDSVIDDAVIAYSPLFIKQP